MAANESGSQIPSGSVIITPEDMWKAIETLRDTGQRTNEAVTELKLLVNPALADIRKDVETIGHAARDHYGKSDTRLRALEEQSWSSRWVPAIVMSLLVSTIAGVVVYVVTNINP